MVETVHPGYDQIVYTQRDLPADYLATHMPPFEEYLGFFTPQLLADTPIVGYLEGLYRSTGQYWRPKYCESFFNQAMVALSEGSLPASVADRRLVWALTSSHCWLELVGPSGEAGTMPETRLIFDPTGVQATPVSICYYPSLYTPFFGSIEHAPYAHQDRYIDARLFVPANATGSLELLAPKYSEYPSWSMADYDHMDA